MSVIDDFATGFYRVNYDNDNWRQLVLQLNTTHREIHVLNRAQLIDDSFNLARAGLLDYAIALDLSTYLNNEDDYIPWYAAMDCLSYVVERMRRSDQGYDYIKVSYHGFRLIVRFPPGGDLCRALIVKKIIGIREAVPNHGNRAEKFRNRRVNDLERDTK